MTFPLSSEQPTTTNHLTYQKPTPANYEALTQTGWLNKRRWRDRRSASVSEQSAPSSMSESHKDVSIHC
jgi:hypothetical protein